jgi:hypothetical protein
MDRNEGGMVYPDDLDETGWPADSATDSRFLHCAQGVKEQAMAQLWEPFGHEHNLNFEELNIEDVPAAQMPMLHHAICTLLDEEIDADLGEYLAELEVFVSGLMRQRKGMTVSL